jgi:prolyl-tRNA editing enzyme YbaK/EbsC (Cys-tRNA(Pro) deacylase)
MSRLENASVRRVRDALVAAGLDDRVIELAETARSAQDAADSIGCELGAIVKSLVFAVNGRAVMALVAGDRQCDTKALPAVLGLDGKCRRADADLVREATGFAIGGIAPIGHATTLPIAIDTSLARFETVYAAAGHSHCVFPVSYPELVRLTGGAESPAIGTAG